MDDVELQKRLDHLERAISHTIDAIRLILKGNQKIAKDRILDARDKLLEYWEDR